MRRPASPSNMAEPAWQRLGHSRPAGMSAAMWSWIADQGSLTRRLKAASGGAFEVRLRQQGWGRALPTELRLLGVGARGKALVREVELLCRGVPWVYARTVIPARSLAGAARRLGHLGTHSLGAVLFASPATRRCAMEYARLSPAQPLYAAAAGALPEPRPPSLWGRRTLFRYAGKPLLVNEIFLPALPL